MYKFAVVIGRFQPFHLGHLKMLEKAFTVGEKVIVVLGSARCARNIKNPFSTAEREEMIRSVLTPEQNAKVSITHVRDYYYNDNMWVAEIQGRVRAIVGDCKNIAIVGHKKDNSSYYLTLFPQWPLEEHNSAGALNATDVRSTYFGSKIFDRMPIDIQKNVLQVPPQVFDWLVEFAKRPEYDALVKEFEFIQAYKKLWESAPYPVHFVTVDAIVIKSGHVLVVKRKATPGKGLMALPGGFKNVDEKAIDGMFRELKEETGIKVMQKELRSAVREYKVFDHPGRSLRGCTITHAYLLDLGNGELPSVKGGDDAEHAFWLPLYDVLAREDEFFEDHAHIITSFMHK
jgi:bifunctional NMN adenylyltransferase/nudix hydrolase